MKISIICENQVPMSMGLTGEHGFAALIEAGGRSILYDTAQGVGLEGNARLLGIDLDSVDTVVISHGHIDHTAGLLAFIENHKARKVVAHPGIFAKKIVERRIGEKTVRLPAGLPSPREVYEGKGVVFELSEGPVEIAEGLWFSGEIPFSNDYERTDPTLLIEGPDGVVPDSFEDDTSLFLQTGKGLTIISACAHRGIVNAVGHARKVAGDAPVHGIIGGIHLTGAEPSLVEKTVEGLKNHSPSFVAAGHCTGLETAAIMKREMGDTFQFLNVGQRFEV